MGNVYTNKNGLRVMEVEYGWGMDAEAIEFPLELAIAGHSLGTEFLLKNPKAQRPDILSMMRYCTDVIDNAKTGEITYILEDFWGNQVEKIKQLIKELK